MELISLQLVIESLWSSLPGKVIQCLRDHTNLQVLRRILNFLYFASRLIIFIITVVVFQIRVICTVLTSRSLKLILDLPNRFPSGPPMRRVVVVKAEVKGLHLFVSFFLEVKICVFFVQFGVG